MPAKSSLALLCAVSTLAVSPAWSQETSPVEKAEAPVDEGEILVTATRRTEALSDVPIAVSAVTGHSPAWPGRALAVGFGRN